MAHSGIENEDARAAHHAAGETSRRDPARATAAHRPSSGLVFPGLRSLARPMSENTLNAALRRLGYGKETMTAHGFRSLASSILNEQHWHKDAIERQLAHGERDKIRAAYNHADYLPERRKMMQAWADYCDELRGHGGKD